MLDLFNKQLEMSQNLTVSQISDAVNHLLDESIPAATKAGFLTRLAIKGETPLEIAGFVSELRARAIHPPLDAETRSREILDVCGTGGDRLNTFNISTTVAIVCSAAGATVAKHGNRAITSKSGSADVLGMLGIPTELSPADAAESLRTKKFAFFFAPLFHPAFKTIAPARALCAEKGQRTIFNFMGPLLNPALPSAQLVGVSRAELCPTVAEVLQRLGARRAMVVSGRVGDVWLDELSTLGETTVAEFYQDKGFTTCSISPMHFPVRPATLPDISGGTPEENAQIIRNILQNKDTGARRDAVLLNAGAALFVAGLAKSIGEGWELAESTLSSGIAFSKLEELRS